MEWLDLNGLSYVVKKFISKLDAKVDKVDGKQLSSNDYTTAEKNKLAGLSNYSHPTSAGNKHIPAGGAITVKFLLSIIKTGELLWNLLDRPEHLART